LFLFFYSFWNADVMAGAGMILQYEVNLGRVVYYRATHGKQAKSLTLWSTTSKCLATNLDLYKLSC
jgi:hypothetical protein